MSAPYPCPCCGYRVFAEPPGSYAICPVCDWEDDALQLEYADTLSGGANAKTLLQAQLDFAAGAARDRKSAAPRDPLWRPIDPRLDTFECFDGGGAGAPNVDESLYYWRPAFWRRAAG